jgi:hypothetical protein
VSCKAALLVLWEDREWFQVGLATLEHEPGCAEAVAALQDLRRRRVLGKKRDSSAHLEPGRDDYRLPMVLPLLSRTELSPRPPRARGLLPCMIEWPGTGRKPVSGRSHSAYCR